jgi:hypothetical protein
MKNKNLFRSSFVDMRQSVGFRANSGSQFLWRNKAVNVNARTYELDQAKMDEEAAQGFLENRIDSQKMPNLTSFLKNEKNLSLDLIDSELFLPRINGHN